MKLSVYFAKFIIVIAYILQHVGISEHAKFRQAGYVKPLSMSQTNREYLVNNNAITAGLHPWSLGLEPETDCIVDLNPTTTARYAQEKAPALFMGTKVLFIEVSMFDHR